MDTNEQEEPKTEKDQLIEALRKELERKHEQIRSMGAELHRLRLGTQTQGG